MTTEHENAPLISIIVAVFNGAKSVQQCIDSVVLQTYSNKELIIIDGGSTDGTIDLLKANQKQIGYWISETDCGIYNAWNKALTQVKGDWICFLGADDYFWDAQVLERVAEQLVQVSSNIRVAYGQVMLVNESGKDLYLFGRQWQDVKECFKKGICITHQGVMHRRSLFELHGKFDESFRIAGDYELMLRELKTNDAYFIQNIIVTAMRVGGVSWVVGNSLQVIRETRRALEMNGIQLPVWFWIIAITKAYLKLILWGVLGERLAAKVRDYYWRVKGLPPFWTRK